MASPFSLSPIRNLFASLRQGSPNPAPGQMARIIPTFMKGKPLPSPQDLAKFADEGYRQNVIVAACIWAIATSAAEPLMKAAQLQKDGTLKDLDQNHPLAVLLRSPNPEQSTFTLLETLFTHQQSMGNWFLRKLRNSYGGVVQVWPYRPDRMTIVPGPDGWTKEYVYKVGGIAQPPIPVTDMIHDPLHVDPLNDYWGLPPIAVAARWIDLDNQAGDFLRAFFANDGTPAGILKIKRAMQPEERLRVQENWKEQHRGHNANSVSVLDTDAEYQKIGADPSKLGMDAIFSESEMRICAAFGVPAIVAQTKAGADRSTYSNFKEARLSFWKDTLVTLYKRCGDRLTHGLAREFGDDLVIYFDLTTVEALQEDLAAQRTFATTAYEGGLLTLNEARRIAGLPDASDGDVFKSASGKDVTSDVA